MPDDIDALKPRKTDEDEPSDKADDKASDEGSSGGAKTKAAVKPKAKAKPKARRDEDEEEDDDIDDEDDDDIDDEDEDEEPPPPRKAAVKSAVKEGARAAKGKPAKKTATRVVKKINPKVNRKRLPPKPASHYVPFAVVGMAIIGLHVFWDVQYAPVAVLGIGLVIWAYMGIGSANEVTLPMDFSTPPALREKLAAAAKFLEEHAYGVEAEVNRAGFRASLPLLAGKRELVKQLGLFAPQMPREHGGAGLSFLEHARLSEVLGRSPLGHYLFNCQAPDAGNMEVLVQYGTPEQRERYLGPLVRGEIRSCFSMTEPDRAGSNPTWLDTSARRDGDQWVINGRKWFTTAADGATFAIVMAVTNPEAPPHLRASQILVPTDTPGFKLVRNISVMGHEGDDWASHAEVAYEDCRVPVGNLLGGEGMGFMIAQDRLGPGRIHHCMRWIGICERSFDLMCRHAASREVSPGKPLGTRQMVQEWVAESRAEIDAARLMVQHAAWKIDTAGLHGARDDISAIKFYVAGVLQRVIDRAIQAHGALGLTDDLPLAWFYRHERAARIYDGPDEVHKSALARRILKGYGLKVEGG